MADTIREKTEASSVRVDSVVRGQIPIDYRYLNMDTGCFVASQIELKEQLQPGGTLRALTHYESGQVLIAGGVKSFTETEARIKCQRLTGILAP